MLRNYPTVLEAEETIPKDPRWLLAQRVVASQQLKGSSRLRDFLLYVTECAIREAPEDATEQHIGINVFERSHGYNSIYDSIFSTHARLLRQKLAAYFADEGSSEEILIEIPKGHYLPVFRPVVSTAEIPKEETASAVVADPHPPGFIRNHFRYPLAISIVLIATAIFGWWARSKSHISPSTVELLWHPFLSNDPPLVVYSNPLFARDLNSRLRIASAHEEQAPPSGIRFVDNYTGVGEVVAVSELTHLFDAHNSTFILKRSRLVTWDEARLKNLIFIGAQSQNPAAGVLPSTTDFEAVQSADSSGIADLHPKKGEPELYSRPEYPLTKDYAIIAMLPGPQHHSWMFEFSGLTTLGTQAAVEYACQPEGAGELVHAASSPSGEMHSFEAVLEMTLSGGVALQTKLLSVHVH